MYLLSIGVSVMHTMLSPSHLKHLIGIWNFIDHFLFDLEIQGTCMDAMWHSVSLLSPLSYLSMHDLTY